MEKAVNQKYVPLRAFDYALACRINGQRESSVQVSLVEQGVEEAIAARTVAQVYAIPA